MATPITSLGQFYLNCTIKTIALSVRLFSLWYASGQTSGANVARKVTSRGSRAGQSFGRTFDLLKKKIEEFLSPLAIFGVIAATIVGGVTNWVSVRTLYDERPLLTGAVIAVVAILVIWALTGFGGAGRFGRWLTATRISAVVLVIIGYALIVIYPRTCSLTNLCGPSRQPSIHINLLSTSAYAAERPALEILNESVDQTRSSFILQQNDMSIHAARETTQRLSLEFDRQMYGVFQSASCRGVNGEAPIEDALPVWRSLLKDRGRNDLVQRLADYDGYRNLIQHGGDRGFIDARPTKAELVDLKSRKPDWYSLVLRWLVECVGVADPVLVWTLRNNTNRDMTLSAVDYEVLDVGQVAGGGPDTLEPIDVLPHDLVHTTGLQSRGINPQILLHAGNTVAIRIFYRLDDRAPGYTWLLRPVFRTLEGDTATGPELKIFGAKFTRG